MCGVTCAAAIDALEYGQDLGGFDLGNGASAEPGEHVVLHPGFGIRVGAVGDLGAVFSHPGPGDCLKGIGRPRRIASEALPRPWSAGSW